MVMPVRSAVGDVPTWEIALSVVMVIAAVYGFTRLGGYIYKGAILKVGSRVRLRDAWRSARS